MYMCIYSNIFIYIYIYNHCLSIYDSVGMWIDDQIDRRTDRVDQWIDSLSAHTAPSLRDNMILINDIML